MRLWLDLQLLVECLTAGKVVAGKVADDEERIAELRWAADGAGGLQGMREAGSGL